MKQSLFDIRCEWAEQGVLKLRDECDVLIVVDVLSFSTTVSLACQKGATIYPAKNAEQASQLAKQHHAHLAVSRDKWKQNLGEFCLSPSAFESVTPQHSVVLPSPNGSFLVSIAEKTPVLVGCLRNARAVAAAAMHLGSTIGVIPAGERWEDNSLRPAWEDLIGAGAIINELDGERSPEAAVAEMAYLSVVGEIEVRMRKTVSGRELINRDFEQDIVLACEENAEKNAPRLAGGAFAVRS